MSGAIKALEANLGEALFEHTPIGLRPTAAAIRLRDYAVWLAVETEQAFLDTHAGTVGPVEPVPVLTYAIPRCSVVDWAMMRGLFSSVSQSGPRGTLVSSQKSEPEGDYADGVLIRYQLTNPGRPSLEDDRLEDSWSLLVLGGSTDITGPLTWTDLAKFRVLVPAMVPHLKGVLKDTPYSLNMEIVPVEEAGAPYTLLDRKDAALLLPASSLPDQFAGPGLQVLSVTGAPITPTIEVEMAGVSQAKRHLVRSITAQLRHSLAASAAPPRMRSLEARLDLHTLRCFRATMETGNTARAAQACFIVQPALSAQIKKLEGAVSRRLFSRSHAGMTPTPAGRRLHGLIEPVLSDHATALDRLRDGLRSGQRRQRVRLGMVPAANEDSLIAEGAADALSGWRAEFADTPISVAEGYTSVLLRWLRTHLIDLAIIDTTESQPGLEVMPIFREPITLVFAPGSVWDTGREVIEGHALATGQLVIPSKRFGLRELFDRALAESEVNIVPDLEVDSLAIALRLVRSGDWATVLPPSAVHRQLREGRLKRRLLVRPTIERRICAALRSRTHLEVETAALLRRLDQAFRVDTSAGEMTFHAEARSRSSGNQRR